MSTVGDVRVITLDGLADLAAAPALHTAFNRAFSGLDDVRIVVVDLDGLTVLDDAAIGLLIGVAARAREVGASLVAVCTNARIAARLRATRVDEILVVTTGIAEAAEQHAPGTP